MVFTLILHKTRNDLNMLSSRYNEKSSIFLGKEILEWNLLQVFLRWGKVMKKYVAYYIRKTGKLEKNGHKEYILLMWFLKFYISLRWWICVTCYYKVYVDIKAITSEKIRDLWDQRKLLLEANYLDVQLNFLYMWEKASE